MEGFTKAQLRAFSKRSAQIESELEAKGAMYESPTLRMRADDEASLATRAAKDRSLTPSLLAGRWQGEAGQVGLATGADLDQALCADPARSGAPGWDEVAAALVDPETGLCSRSARFTQADVVEHICALSAGRMSVEEIVVMADRFVGSDLAVRLTPDIAAGRPRPAQWSTAAHRALEDRTLALMGTLAARPSAGSRSPPPRRRSPAPPAWVTTRWPPCRFWPARAGASGPSAARRWISMIRRARNTGWWC